MALRHREHHLATRSAHTLQAIISHDTANHPAPQRQAAFTAACFALPSGAGHLRYKLATSESSTRLPPKVKRRVSKTSVSYETSSKNEAPSLQNERFVRDFHL